METTIVYWRKVGAAHELVELAAELDPWLLKIAPESDDVSNNSAVPRKGFPDVFSSDAGILLTTNYEIIRVDSNAESKLLPSQTMRLHMSLL